MAKKILLVEDEKVLAEMYVDKFKEAGFGIVAVCSAEEGIEAVKKEKPDLVVLDILLPKQNGIKFLAQMRKESEISSIPVVAFSNYDDPETKKQAFRLGVKDYLIKTNYTPEEVIERIKGYLNT